MIMVQPRLLIKMSELDSYQGFLRVSEAMPGSLNGINYAN